ncbi:hypothetical protein [Tichowtungia aerotolerans]|uniref:Uncharacterized protein n=1 Tax=Tichowtungia aerotolerans TaxID=2697043 RepID=A0A6P1MD22_9BACT|nr:hypothetical protein [Tichowtungia aerotolerans]QHI70474.1 hypothetical protein GT409_13845 [Tichowtungia aerotolerans]
MINSWTIDGRVAGFEGSGCAVSEVADNTTKLALSGLAVGDIAVITNEGGRVEMLTVEGGESSDDNWAVLKNTVYLTAQLIYGGGTLVIDGVAIGSTTTVVGWVDPSDVSLYMLGSSTFDFASSTCTINGDYVGTFAQPAHPMGDWMDMDHAPLPGWGPYPPRAVVYHAYAVAD